MSEVETEYLEIFRDEARERLDRIVESLLALEAGEQRADVLEELFRDTHTIKGAAGMVGMSDVKELAHAMEDVLDGVRAAGAFPPSLAEPLLHAADALRRHVDGGGEAIAPFVDRLRAVVPEVEAITPARARTTGLTGSPAPRRAIRVAPEKIDTVLDLVGETVLHRRRLEHALADDKTSGGRAVADELDLGERLLEGLKDAAIGMRTLPLASIVGPLPRAVRDLAVETGKDVQLAVVGADTELDRAILEGVADQLAHILRNAVAHGIETPAERERAGKPARGRVELRAEQRGGVVEIVVADDGRGVPAEVLETARRSGSLTDLLTTAGYSTAEEVSGIAGRGVGLDAVRTHVESYGGSLEIRSEAGRGTEVVIVLPLALALLEVLLVERAGSVFALPLASIDEAISVTETLSLAGHPAIELRGASLPLVDLVELVGGQPVATADQPPAVVLRASGRRVAAICDTLLGKDEIVVKPLGGLLAGLRQYLGAAILGDGRIALLVDPVAAVQAAAGRRARRAAPPLVPAALPAGPRRVLVVEDSLVVRELQRGILEAAGYRVETAQDGREAMRELQGDERVDIVITDIDMPEMDGLELTTAIRAHTTYATLPVVVVTSRGSDDDRRRGIDAGADAYIVKGGFDQQVLIETVGRLVGASTAPRGPARRVLICEDSPTFAAALSRLLERDREIDVIGVCATAEDALARLPGLRPDLVTMDLELPGMSGVSAIEQIMGLQPVPILVLSGHVAQRSEYTLQALAAGALDALPKADLDLSDPDGEAARALRSRVKVLSGVRVIRHPRARLAKPSGHAAWGRVASVIGVCASTGGPQTLAALLAGLPATFPIPILVVQHISAGFVEGFARWLDAEVPLPVRMAAPGAVPAAGVWIAPDGGHLVLDERGRLALDVTTDAGPHRPAGDVLLSSLAAAAGRDAVAVVLTGMGRDGAEGLRRVRLAGGLTMAQDEASSIVFGMPRAALEEGCELVLAPEAIAQRLAALRPPA